MSFEINTRINKFHDVSPSYEPTYIFEAPPKRMTRCKQSSLMKPSTSPKTPAASPMTEMTGDEIEKVFQAYGIHPLIY